MSTLRMNEDLPRDIENDGARFWTTDLDEWVHGKQVATAFGVGTVGIVDELAGGIVAYAHVENAEAIIDALRASLGEV